MFGHRDGEAPAVAAATTIAASCARRGIRTAVAVVLWSGTVVSLRGGWLGRSAPSRAALTPRLRGAHTGCEPAWKRRGRPPPAVAVPPQWFPADVRQTIAAGEEQAGVDVPLAIAIAWRCRTGTRVQSAQSVYKAGDPARDSIGRGPGAHRRAARAGTAAASAPAWGG